MHSQQEEYYCRVQDLTIGYGEGFSVENINIQFNQGSIVGVLGRNGSGKSTFLKTFLGLQPALSGKIIYKEKDILKISNKDRSLLLSAVLQEKTQAELTVKELMLLGRLPYQHFLKGSSTRDKEIVYEIATELKLTIFLNRLVGTLSDGERQKVMVARALVQDTPFVVMDEPTVFLDIINTVEIFRLVQKYKESKKHSWLISTHNLQVALQICTHLLIFDSGKYYFGKTSELIESDLLTKIYQKEGITIDSGTGSFTF